VDDDEEIRTQMKWALSGDYDIVLAADRPGAVEIFRDEKPAGVLLDLGLPPNPGVPDEGLATLSDILAVDRFTKVVVITGQNEKEIALRAIGGGAYDFLCKPIDMDELNHLLKRCFHVSKLERQFAELQDLVGGSESFEGILGNSARMRPVFEMIRKVATTDAPVLVLGESGTGKEMVAHAVHKKSDRQKGPFVAINCGAIPENLLESELFGHERGAFTGAHVQRPGRIETANGGTLFLDEVGEMPSALQVKLLRFLQDQTIQRVGGREEIRVDTRVIAATNADLKKNMASGSFREDLFYRLAVVQILLPPLREREEDILLLAKFFLHRFAAEGHKTGLAFDTDALRALNKHPWPGNVRELENCVRRAVILAEGKRVTARDLELNSGAVDTNGAVTIKDAREAVERQMIQQALRKYSGKIAPAAAELGLSRPTIYELMDKLGIVRPNAELAKAAKG
ncbi:MAG TPA: PEP-CTERM-box response regulator transcription factor, partial [Verrucomicrobiae bacterium]|nr:PEP-CTERM-box response regulator transcription factor [Verrucomicrobiae bacterium]